MKKQSGTIQWELFRSYSVLIVLVLVLGVGTFFTIFLTQVERQLREYNLNLCSRLALQLDSEIDRMDDVAQRIIFSKEVWELFCEPFTEMEREEAYENQLKLAERVNSLCGPSYRLAQVNLFSDEVRFISIKGYSSVREMPPQKVAWRPREYPGNRILLSPSMRGDGSTAFSLIRELALPSYYQQQGYVEVQQSYSVFEGLIESSQETAGSSSVYVFTSGWEAVYPYGEGALAESCLAFAQRASRSDTPASRMQISHGRVELYVCAKAQKTGWVVVMVDSQPLFGHSITVYLCVTLFCGAAAMLLALLVSYFISRRITRPIAELQEQIRSMNPVTLEASAPRQSGKSFNEIQRLSFAFENLCGELARSADETAAARAYLLQARLLALQSQMNPHFLYNTLSAIGIMAEEEGAVQTMDMLLALSDMLSYVSGSDMSPVEFAVELECTENFLSLLKIRFEDQIAVETHIPDALLSIRVPKLVLEPLVENWSKYGMRGEGVSRLAIFGEMEAGRWQITVSDNGPGFSEEVLAALQEQMQNVLTTGEIPGLQIHKMGLLNIFIRLHYAYGKNAVFKAENTPSGSGQVTIGGTYYDDDEGRA